MQVQSGIFEYLFSLLNINSIYSRKLFHVTPAIILPIIVEINYSLFILMLVGAFYIFYHLELVRYFGGERINQRGMFGWMHKLNESRERYFWFTHLFLYLGLVLPYLYFRDTPLTNISVILTMGDAMAAIIGTKFGKHKMKKSRKSV